MSDEVYVEIDQTKIENDDGVMVQGVVATCTECEHTTQSYGTSERSVRRCLALLREECPMGERNFYVTDGF